MKGQFVLVSRLAARDLRRRPVEAVMVFLVIAAATTTLTVAFALSGVTNQPYQRTRLATAGPDVVAVEAGGGPGPVQPVSSAQRAATVASLTKAPGVTAHSGPYPTAHSVIRFRGHTVDVVAEGRDRAPASVDQPEVTQGGWIRPGAVVIERCFADALGAHVGDHVRLGGRSFRVDGIAVTAAVPPYPSSLCHIACPFPVPMGSFGVPNMGLVWLTRSAVAGLAGSGSNIGYLLNLKLANPAQAPAFVAQHPGTFTWQSIQSAINALIGIEQAALAFGGWLIGILALAGLGVLVGRRMTEQSKRVGLLKAVGATPMTVAGVLLFEHIALALAAATVGPHGLARSPPSPTHRASLPADHCSPLFRRACPCRFSWPCVSSHVDRDVLCSTPSASPSLSPALLRSSPTTARQATAGLSMAALLPALPGAVIGMPLGIAVYRVLASGRSLTVPPAWQLVGVFLATLLAVAALTAIPSRLAARQSPARVLQTE